MSEERKEDQTFEVSPDEVWRCENGHERLFNPLVVRPGAGNGFSLFDRDGSEHGPFCWDCLIELLERHIPKMIKQEEGEKEELCKPN